MARSCGVPSWAALVRGLLRITLEQGLRYVDRKGKRFQKQSETFKLPQEVPLAQKGQMARVLYLLPISNNPSQLLPLSKRSRKRKSESTMMISEGRLKPSSMLLTLATQAMTI